MDRRKLVTGLISFLAAPAIVRADALMPIRGDVYRFWDWRSPLLPDLQRLSNWKESRSEWIGPNGRLYEGIWTLYGKDRNIYSDECVAFRKQEYAS